MPFLIAFRVRNRQYARVDEALLDAVHEAFGADSDSAKAILMTYGEEPWHPEVDRVRRAILKLSKGDLRELQVCTDMARRDYRDVLMYAEYPTEPEAPQIDIAGLEAWAQGLPPDDSQP